MGTLPADDKKYKGRKDTLNPDIMEYATALTIMAPLALGSLKAIGVLIPSRELKKKTLQKFNRTKSGVGSLLKLITTIS